jgi:acyl-CoA synthetase
VRCHANERPDAAAIITPERTSNWLQYDRLADRIAAAVAGPAAAARRDRIAVLLPDGLAVHAALVGAQRAGVVAVGIGIRAGVAEIAHLLRRTGAQVLVTADVHRERTSGELLAALADHGVAVRSVVEIDSDDGVTVVENGEPVAVIDDRAATEVVEDLKVRALGPTEVSMLNSTSGTTGLPKCVMQFESRWFHFSNLAAEAGPLGPDDVFLGAVPAPFGFGLWTSHFAPIALGVPAVVLPRFRPQEMIQLIERERVTVLCCVSTQFRMLLNSPAAYEHDLSSLRVMFTGGEALPFEQAAEFERRTGALVLQFFGSNETGAFSYTRHTDPADVRLGTAGRVMEHMNVRVFDDEGGNITATGQPGQPGGVGPLTCLGYYDDPEANAELFTADGAMLMGDLVTMENGCLRIVGRKSDIVIRGGKNISAAEVEAEVATHPAVDLVVVVPVADPVFGEKVAALVTLRPEASELTLDDLCRHLDIRGTTKERHPEYLVIVDRIPRSTGGKLAKAEARRLVAERLAERV